MSDVDPRALRDAFGAFMTGVTVVTTTDARGQAVGFTANSFTSVSLDPPLLLVCIARHSTNLDAFAGASGFAVNILAESQREISKTFASPVEDRFAAVRWRPGPHGSPVFEDVAAWFDCALHHSVDAGDHLILLGHVQAFHDSGAAGLGYTRGAYFTSAISEHAMTAAASHVSVMLGAVISREDCILVVPGKDGSLSIPTTPLAATSTSGSDLDGLLDGLGLSASHGFVYAVYEQRGSGTHFIVYRCSAAHGQPRVGEFMPLRGLPLERFSDPATVVMLRRYCEESRLGNFGVYFGDAKRGEVRPRGAVTTQVSGGDQ